MLVYCGFETDMGGSTSRVVYHQLGIAGDRERDSPETIREHLDRLLREPVYAEAVGRMRSAYVARVENRVAERIIESLLSQ
jgi:UDP:flavonoid glycosyltransferase YjiC (YdhE family)